MRYLYNAFCGALLILGLAGLAPEAGYAGGYHWDSACNCRRSDSQYTTHRYVPLPPRVVTHRRVVNRTRVVRGNTRLVQENRVIVHVQPVIHREVIVHRTNTIVRDVVLHRVNSIARFREEPRYEVVNRYTGGYVRHVTEYRNVRGVSCNCGEQVFYRD
jgi:hypothetical protein